jgi:hypothetical protein
MALAGAQALSRSEGGKAPRMAKEASELASEGRRTRRMQLSWHRGPRGEQMTPSRPRLGISGPAWLKSQPPQIPPSRPPDGAAGIDADDDLADGIEHKALRLQIHRVGVDEGAGRVRDGVAIGAVADREPMLSPWCCHVGPRTGLLLACSPRRPAAAAETLEQAPRFSSKTPTARWQGIDIEGRRLA